VAKVVQNFNQEQVHVRSDPLPDTDTGHIYDDRTFNTPTYTIHLRRDLSRQEIEDLYQRYGLDGATVAPKRLEFHYGRSPTEPGGIEQWEQSVHQLIQSLGGNAEKIKSGTARLGIYGRGDWAIPYRDIEGELRPGPPADNPAARRVWSRTSAWRPNGLTSVPPPGWLLPGFSRPRGGDGCGSYSSAHSTPPAGILMA
jgi:hypothetical protein